MNDGPQGQPKTLAARAQTFAVRLKALSKGSDKREAWIEGVSTATGAIALALGGAVVGKNSLIGIALLAIGALATIAALVVVIRRHRGTQEILTDAIIAIHDSELALAEGRKAAVEADLRVAQEQKASEALRVGLQNAMESMAVDQTQLIKQANERIERVQAVSERRNRCLLLNQHLLEFTERFLLRPEADRKLDTGLDFVLATIKAGFLDAFGFANPTEWTISIFQRIHDPASQVDRLERLRVLRWDRQTIGGRSWLRGESYSGYAWDKGEPLIIGDTSDREKIPGLAGALAKMDPADARRYRSVAAIPVKLGGSSDVWGVTTATSNRAGHFGGSPGDTDAQLHADSVRSLARFVSLLVAGSKA